MPPERGPQEVHGEAWFRTHDAERRLEWGSEGPSDYRGELRVEPEGEGARILLLIHAPHDHDDIDESLARSLDSIATVVGPAGDGA